MKLNVLCIGDIVGRPGRRILAEKLKSLVEELSVDCVIANAENAAGGSGLTPQIYNKLLRYGVKVTAEVGDFTDKMLMLRYDEAVFVQVDDPAELPGHSTPQFR